MKTFFQFLESQMEWGVQEKQTGRLIFRSDDRQECYLHIATLQAYNGKNPYHYEVIEVPKFVPPANYVPAKPQPTYTEKPSDDDDLGPAWG